jgi:hypothetical protein
LDLLQEIDKNAILPADLKPKLKRGAMITFSISTLDEGVAKIIEPGAPSPAERLETMKKAKRRDFSPEFVVHLLCHSFQIQRRS